MAPSDDFPDEGKPDIKRQLIQRRTAVTRELRALVSELENIDRQLDEINAWER
jgi:hypothetical protein